MLPICVVSAETLAHVPEDVLLYLRALRRQAVLLSAEVRGHYGLELEPGLAEVVATDLLADPGSAVAPTLQVLLSVMYDAAWKRGPDRLLLSQRLYRELKESGLHLGEFLD